MKFSGRGLSITQKIKMVAKNWMRSFLANSAASSISRKLLRNFPPLQEAVWLGLYFFRKKMLISTTVPYVMNGNHDRITVSSEKRQLLIDISGIVLRDVHTGVQRVARSLLQELLNNPPSGFVVEPVYADASGNIRYARTYARTMLNEDAHESEDPIIAAYQGDIFFCPDLYYPYPFSTLLSLQRQGMHITFTIYDLIPLKYPKLFSKALHLSFSDWLSGVMAVADGVVCDSLAVANEVGEWLNDHPDLRNRVLPIGFFHLGADIEASKPTFGIINEGADILAACQNRPTMLMVGTVEPRKGHAQVLAAVDLLWKDGVDINLIIIGKEGWRTQHLTSKLRRHSERYQRLFWLEGASDRLLLQLYASASALIAASFAEGFGLPLIEAARQSLPIIARDIPVFREVAGEHAFYFQGETPEELAKAIRRWLVLYTEGNAPSSTELPWLTWAQTVRKLQDVILGNQWCRVWMPHTEDAGLDKP
ncbi:glycosyltransferase family 4 protein [Acidithiobacillus sp.]